MQPLVAEATYRNGVLRPAAPLPLEENQPVRITIDPADSPVHSTVGLIPCSDAKLIEHVEARRSRSDRRAMTFADPSLGFAKQ